MRTNLIITICLLISAQIIPSLSSASGELGNGGFLYSRTSKVLLEQAQKSLKQDLALTLNFKEEPVYVSSGCRKRIDLNELNQLISNISYNYNTHASAINPDGMSEPKYFNIQDKKNIEATQIYFASFVDSYFRYLDALQENDIVAQEKILTPIRLAAIHEALHLFGYNEFEARSCSLEVNHAIEMTNTSKKARYTSNLIKTNTLILSEKFESTQCLTSKRLKEIQDMKRYSNFMVPIFQTPEYLLIECMHRRMGPITPLNKDPRSIQFMREDLSRVLAEASDLKEVARYLNTVIKFSFLEALPE
ncbi:MAG TPA: hypothetical protein PLJ21_03370 [Pseudobdellovibrionaceae bacterium]|nr:hypothetical protein [Pseudobdellovibrionaceae bacterium]